MRGIFRGIRHDAGRMDGTCAGPAGRQRAGAGRVPQRLRAAGAEFLRRRRAPGRTMIRRLPDGPDPPVTWIDRLALAFAGALFGVLTLFGYVIAGFFIAPGPSIGLGVMF